MKRKTIFPAHTALSIFLWAVISGVVGLLSLYLGTTILRDYGLLLFCGVPMAMGVIAPLGHALGARRPIIELFLVNFMAQCILFVTMFLLGIEGLGCMIMCAPLWFGAALLGTTVAVPIQHVWWGPEREPPGFPVTLLLLIVALPLCMGAESTVPHEPPLIQVSTIVDIDAPPEIVWNFVIAFPELPPPDDWIFSLGVAYPTHAFIDGHGAGAVRHCEFSTGSFVEPITTWDENHLLAFNVSQSPPSMHEVSLYPDIHPAHLDGYLISQRGQFLLTPLPGGRTRLEGTTWYSNRMFPTAYWQLWSDTIIHRIHTRVLTHIKALSESDTATRDGAKGWSR